VEVSSSRLLKADTPLFSQALSDGRLDKPWISGETLQNRMEFIRIQINKGDRIHRIRFFNGYKKPTAEPDQKAFCEEWAAKEQKNYAYKQYKYIYGKEKKLLYPPECLSQENPESFSSVKKVEIKAFLVSGLMHSTTLELKPVWRQKDQSKEYAPYWVEIDLKKQLPQSLKADLERLELLFTDFYYGVDYNNLALGELELFGRGNRQKNSHQLANWYSKYHSILLAREYIYGKEFKLIDGTLYRFNTDMSYEFITGLNSSSIGSEKGSYALHPNGILLKFKRYEIEYDDSSGPLINDLSQIRLSGDQERILNVVYIRSGLINIQGNPAQWQQ